MRAKRRVILNILLSVTAHATFYRRQKYRAKPKRDDGWRKRRDFATLDARRTAFGIFEKARRYHFSEVLRKIPLARSVVRMMKIFRCRRNEFHEKARVVDLEHFRRRLRAESERFHIGRRRA